MLLTPVATAKPPASVEFAAKVAVAALPDVLWLPAVFTPGRFMLADPLKETPPIVRAVCRNVAVEALPDNAPETVGTVSTFVPGL